MGALEERHGCGWISLVVESAFGAMWLFAFGWCREGMGCDRHATLRGVVWEKGRICGFNGASESCECMHFDVESFWLGMESSFLTSRLDMILGNSADTAEEALFCQQVYLFTLRIAGRHISSYT